LKGRAGQKAIKLGEYERAFVLLERAYAAHDIQLVFLGIDPGLDPLRGDPRFQDLLHRVGLATKARLAAAGLP